MQLPSSGIGFNGSGKQDMKRKENRDCYPSTRIGWYNKEPVSTQVSNFREGRKEGVKGEATRKGKDEEERRSMKQLHSFRTQSSVALFFPVFGQKVLISSCYSFYSVPLLGSRLPFRRILCCSLSLSHSSHFLFPVSFHFLSFLFGYGYTSYDPLLHKVILPLSRMMSWRLSSSVFLGCFILNFLDKLGERRISVHDCTPSSKV